MIGIAVGLLSFNIGEWLTHKYVLHGLGKKSKDSFWAFHFFEHHKETRRHQGHDPNYEKPLLGWHAQSKEALALAAVAVAHAPLLPVAPFFTATVWYSLWNYHRVHKRSHLDPAWAREHLPWHYDHHMGPDQEQNWGVTHDWADRLFGTRVPYVGTDKERADIARQQAKQQAQAARAGAGPAPGMDASDHTRQPLAATPGLADHNRPAPAASREPSPAR